MSSKILNAATATIIGHCEVGGLGAVNIARESSKRRRWRISEQHIAEFEQRRQNKPEPTAPNKRSHDELVRHSDHFACHVSGQPKLWTDAGVLRELQIAFLF